MHTFISELFLTFEEFKNVVFFFFLFLSMWDEPWNQSEDLLLGLCYNINSLFILEKIILFETVFSPEIQK